MAYFSSVWKARIIERCRQEYENEKINSILTSKTEIPKKTMMQKWRFYEHNTRKRFKGRLRKLFPDGSSVSNLYFYLKSDHAFPSLLMKSAIGFVGGIALTYLCFIFFVYQLSISYLHATVMSSIIGVLLTLGLAFSWRIRCLVFLLIPQMFSRVGRYTLTCYALVLILTGPAPNTLRNSEVLTESMACSQEQIKISVRQISDSVKKPFNTMKRPVKLIRDRIKRVTYEMNRIVSRISAIVTNIGDFIQSSFTWLNKIAEVCTKKFGTPHDRCMSAILKDISNCNQSLGNLPRLYNESHVAESVCSLVGYGTVCVVADYATASFSATLRRKLRNFMARINKTLNLEIDIHHTHIFSNNDSYASPIAAGLVTDIRKKADPLLKWLSWSSCITSLFLLLIIFRAKYYQHMFETRSRFDNRYVTKELRELDLKRYRERRETVLPLNKREQAKYICTTSFNLVASEKVYLTRSMVFMAITTFKLLIHMVADYSLYWVLITIRYQGNMKTPESDRSDIGIQVTGSSMVADFIRSLIESIVLPLLPKTPSTTSCLPKPHPPDLQRYMHIGILIILLWFFALFEPYGLRLRHIIMGHYQPDRAKARALWLFNHILRTRGSFMKLARRKLHREHKYSDQEHLTFRYWINSVVPCSCLKRVFGSSETKHCLLCNTLEELTDIDTMLTSCETLNCPGVYCVRCFSDIGRLCTICLSPAEYGDVSDVSLEKGSSDSGTDDEDDNKHDSFNMRGSEKERLINKKNIRKDNKHQGSSHSNDSGQRHESSLSLLNHQESDGKCNRPLMNLSYGSMKDIDGDTKHRDKYGFKEIQENVNKDLPNGGKLPKKDKNFNNNIELTNNKKESNLGNFLVRKKVKMKHQKKMSHNLALKRLFQLLYKRMLPLERYSKILRKKYIKVCTVQKKKRVRTRSQIKLIFARNPKKSYKLFKSTNKCLIGKVLITNSNNINNENQSNKRKYIRKRLTHAKFRNVKGYKINKIRKFYKLSYCGHVPNKANLKGRKKRGNSKYLCREENLITQYKNAEKLPTLRSERHVMEYQNNVNTDSYCDRSNKFRYNSEHNSKEKSYRTFWKIEKKTVRTPIPFMKEICMRLTSVLSIWRYHRKSRKQKTTAEKSAMALPLQKSRSCQCIGECLDLSRDTNQRDDVQVKPLFKQLKELDQKVNFETSSEKLSSSKLSLSDTKTNTTVCSWCIIEYIKRKAKYKNVDSGNKKETNKDIATDRSKLCNVSTSTDDWWSPLEERKFISYFKGDKGKN